MVDVTCQLNFNSRYAVRYLETNFCCQRFLTKVCMYFLRGVPIEKYRYRNDETRRLRIELSLLHALQCPKIKTNGTENLEYNYRATFTERNLKFVINLTEILYFSLISI